MRLVSMRRNPRNINRMTRLFAIEHDFSGCFTSRLGNGHKMSKGDRIIFAFPSKTER